MNPAAASSRCAGAVWLAGFVVLAGGGCAPVQEPRLFDAQRDTRAYVERADGPLELTLYRPVERTRGNDSPVAPAGAALRNRPMFVLLHGGSFHFGTRRLVDGFAEHFAGQGFVSASVSYRLAPRHRFPAAVQDAFAAVRYLRAHAEELGGDPQRMGAFGISAGGVLAMFLGYCQRPDEQFGDCGDATVEPRVQAVVNVYGACDLTYHFDKANPWVKKLVCQYMGCRLEEDPARWRLASPLYCITPDAAPTLTIHGRRDGIVGFEQALRLDAALRAAGVEHRLAPIEAGHAWGYRFGSKDAYKLLPAVTAFLVRTLER